MVCPPLWVIEYAIFVPLWLLWLLVELLNNVPLFALPDDWRISLRPCCIERVAANRR